MVCWLDKPFIGAHLLSHILGEVIDDDLEVMEEERARARLVPHDNLAVLVVRQDIGQVRLMVRATLVLRCHHDRVMDNMSVHCRLRDQVVHVPGGEVGRVELEAGVGVVLADLRERNVVVDLDSALTCSPEAIVAIGPVIRPDDRHFSEDSIELGMNHIAPSRSMSVDHIQGKSLVRHRDSLGNVLALSIESSDAVRCWAEPGLFDF